MLPTIVQGPHCGGCPNQTRGERLIPPQGTGSSGIMVVGDSGWYEEAAAGYPFAGASGSLLDKVLRKVGIERGSLTITNTTWCFPGDSIVRARGIQKVYRRWYVGPLITIKTNKGWFRGTPNHPAFLTGFEQVPLKRLKKGDQLIFDLEGQHLGSPDPNIDYGPTTFEQLFSSLNNSGVSHRAADTIMNFHGDGANSQVDIVQPKDGLLFCTEAFFSEPVEDINLVSPDNVQPFLPSAGNQCHSGQDDLLPLVTTTDSGVGIDSQGFSPSFPYKSKPRSIGLRPSPQSYSHRPELVSQPTTTNSIFLSQPLDTTTTKIQQAEVVEVHVSWFSGHVYNLQTIGGKYTISGILMSNCRAPRLNYYDQAHKIPEAAAVINHCRPYLEDLIEKVQPKVIVPLGNVALNRICGVTGIEKRHSYFHGTTYGCWAIPSFHPSGILQGNQKLTPALMFALRRAQEVARGVQPRKFDLMLDPSPSELQAYIDRLPPRIPVLVVDIETPQSSTLDEDEVEEKGLSYIIERAGFAAEEVGVSFSWAAPYKPLLQEVINRADLVVEWADNHFDWKRLTANGIEIPFNKIVSGMWAWHFLHSDLPKALGFAAPFFVEIEPWKHLSEAEPAYYNAMDNVVTWVVWNRVRDRLIAEGRWEVFLRHCHQMEPILLHAHKAGVLVDPVVQGEVKATLEAERDAIDGQIQERVPVAVRPVKRWKRQPKDPQAYLVERILEEDCEAGVRGEVLEWYEKLLPFNTGSSLQVINLIKHLGLKVPVSRKENRETTEAKHLKALAKKNQIFRLILDKRERDKLIDAYMWKLDEGNRIHSTAGWHPSTWRKSYRNPSTQTWPKRNSLAQTFRRMIVATPGTVLAEADSSAIEAVLVGHWAGSQRYIRLAKAGVHGWVTAAKLGKPISLSLSDEELSAACKAVKHENPDLYEQMKRVVHLSNYKGTPQRILEEYPDLFSSLKQAKDLQGLYLETEAGQDVLNWQRQTMEEAHRNGYLDNSWKYRHYFYDVFTWKYASYKRLRSRGIPDHLAREQAWGMGDDAKRAVAFRPQSDASAIQTEIVLSWTPELLEFLRLLVHDATISEVPYDSRLEERLGQIYQSYVQPWGQLGGLSIGAEVSWGLNAGKQSKVNPDGMREWRPK